MENEAPQQHRTNAESAPVAEVPPTAPATGRRLAFRDVKRELTDEDLASSGTQKLILDMLLAAELERDDYKEYLKKYYDADTRAQVLEEKLKSNDTNETLFAVGVGIGGAIIGLAPLYWDKPPAGVIALIIGGLLAGGAVAGRLGFRKKMRSTTHSR